MKIQKTADGFDTLFSEEYGQTFHSKHGVLQEAKHLFLKGAGVAERLQKKLPTSVLEIGFGTGFNFFLTASEALACKAKLEFTSVEKELLSYELFCELNHDQLSPESDLRFQFLDWRKSQPENIPTGKYEIGFKKSTVETDSIAKTSIQNTKIKSNKSDGIDKDEIIHLSLIIGNALNISFPKNRFDAVYLDAFSPDTNPELWTKSFFEKLFFAMKPGALLSTYSAKGSVKRAMQKAGFEVIKKAGPIGKREMLTARKVK